MPTSTPNLNLTLPDPNVSVGWGGTLNADFTLIDNLFSANGSGTSIGINVGSGKTASIGGTLIAGGTVILGSGDNTNTVTSPVIRGAARTGTDVVGANLTIDACNGTGTGGSGKITFRTAPAGSSSSTANTFANRLVIDSSGNVGVGTASPSVRLDVADSQSVANLRSTGASNSTLNFYSSTSTLEASIASVNGGASLIFNTGASATERFRIGSSGQLGVGGANYGTSGQVLVSGGSSAAPSWGTVLTRATAISTTSGTSHDFTGIPSSVKRITIIMSGVSTNGNSTLLFRIGDSSGVSATGYTSNTWGAAAPSSNMAINTQVTGFGFGYLDSASAAWDGVLTLVNITGNTWVISGVSTSAVYSGVTAGSKTLSGVLTSIRLTTFGGTNTFDAGTVNIMYE